MYLSYWDIYPNVAVRALIIFSKLSDQQKNQRAIIIKIRIFNQTHNIKLAENLSHITKKIDEVIETTKTLGEKVKKIRC